MLILLDGMDTIKHDYHTVSETGSNATTMRKVKPSAGFIAFMLTGRKKNKNAGKSSVDAGIDIDVIDLASGIIALIRSIMS